MVVLNKLIVKTLSIINHKSPVAILSIISCFHDLTRVLPHIRTAVALGFIILGLFAPSRGTQGKKCALDSH